MTDKTNINTEVTDAIEKGKLEALDAALKKNPSKLGSNLITCINSIAEANDIYTLMALRLVQYINEHPNKEATSLAENHLTHLTGLKSKPNALWTAIGKGNVAVAKAILDTLENHGKLKEALEATTHNENDKEHDSENALAIACKLANEKAKSFMIAMLQPFYNRAFPPAPKTEKVTPVESTTNVPAPLEKDTTNLTTYQKLQAMSTMNKVIMGAMVFLAVAGIALAITHFTTDGLKAVFGFAGNGGNETASNSSSVLSFAYNSLHSVESAATKAVSGPAIRF